MKVWKHGMASCLRRSIRCRLSRRCGNASGAVQGSCAARRFHLCAAHAASNASQAAMTSGSSNRIGRRKIRSAMNGPPGRASSCLHRDYFFSAQLALNWQPSLMS